MAATTESPDQRGVNVPMVISGVHCIGTVANQKVTGGSTNVYLFSASYSFHFSGFHLQFRHGGIYTLDAALKAALLAASAPMTQQ